MRRGWISPVRWLRRTLILKGNIKILSVTSIISGIYRGMIDVIWQPFILSLWDSAAFLGLLQSLGGPYRGIIGSLVQVFGGHLSDSRGRKLVIAYGSVSAGIALVLYAFSAYAHDWRILIPATFAFGLAAIGNPPLNAIIAESVKIRKREMAYSTVMFFSLLPGIFTSIIGGIIADEIGYFAIFLISILFEGVNLSLILLFLKETLLESVKKPTYGLKDFLKGLVPTTGLKGLYIAIMADALSWGLGSAILYGLLNKTYSFSNLQLGIMSSMFSISWVASQLPIGKLIEKYGCKRSMLTSELIGILLMSGWLLSTSFEAFAFLSILWGLVASTWVPATQTLLANSVSKEERAKEMGKITAFSGLIAFPAPYIGGVLYDSLGFRAPIFTGLIGVIFTIMIIILLVHEPSIKK